jgi:PAS domain S-box-containing protein
MMERQRTSGERPSHGPLEHAVASVREYAVFLLDASGRVVTWNAGAELIKGYTRDEIVGRHFSCFYPAEARDAGRPDDELRIAAQLGHVEDEGWRLRKDGSRFWANVVITALFDDRKQVRGFLKITRDLTERRQAEDQLRVSEERFRLLVESVEDYAIFMLDPEGHIVSWNVGAHRIKGYAASEILGQHFSTFYPPEEVAIGKPAALLRTALATGQVEDEGWRVRKDGTRFWANVVITAVHDAEGRLRGFAKVTRDLTQRRYIESLESAGREMSEFLAMLSHELRNPLAPIRNAVALMAAREATDPTTQWARDVIDRQTALLAHLVEDLLDVTRITVGKLQLRLEPTDMAAVIGRAVETIRPVVEARRHHLTVSTPEQPLRVVADLVRLTQVLTNILTNAAKYTPDGGRIALILEHDGTEAVVRVRDSGMGIAPELLPRIFDLFAQGQQGLDRREGGLGVGLALARRLMQLHGGSVTASSEGRGRGRPAHRRRPQRAGGGRQRRLRPGPRAPPRSLGLRAAHRARRTRRARRRGDAPAGRRPARHRLARHGRLRGGAPPACDAGVRRDADHRSLGVWPGGGSAARARRRLRSTPREAGRGRPAAQHVAGAAVGPETRSFAKTRFSQVVKRRARTDLHLRTHGITPMKRAPRGAWRRRANFNAEWERCSTRSRSSSSYCGCWAWYRPIP